MDTPPSVLAVCVNFNGAGFLSATLDSILSSSYSNLRTVVVDCDSRDGSADHIPDPVEVIRLSHNPGYGGAINTALRQTAPFCSGDSPLGHPDFVFVMNNDVEIPRRLLTELVRFAAGKGPCVCGPEVRILSRPHLREASWGEITRTHVLAHYHDRETPAGRGSDQALQVPLLLGSALLIDMRVLSSVGLWDERFFMYHEEVDWLFRCGQEGFAVYYCPFVHIHHAGGASTIGAPLRKTRWIRRNSVYFLRKHGASLPHWGKWGGTLLASLAYHAATLRWRRLLTIVSAVRDGFRMELS